VILVKTNSLTFRLTLLFASASTVVLLVLGFLIRHSVDKHFEELDATLLAASMQVAKQALSDATSHADIPVLRKRIDDARTDDNRLAVVAFDKPGVPWVVAGNTNGFPPALISQLKQPIRYPITWHDGNRTYRGTAENISSQSTLGSPVIVAAAVDISHHEHFMAAFQTTLWWFVGIASLLMGLLGLIAANRGLAPLKKIQQDAADISANRLEQRLSVDQLPAELAELGSTLNGMLSRLEDSFKRLSDFSADIAHELRTPVSNMMTQTQVALSKFRTTEEYRDILASNAEELEKMARMISDMLFLAKADHGLIMLHGEPISLAKEFHTIFSFYEALTDENAISMNLDGDAIIFGDKSVLRRAFGNLLSNAIQHTAENGRIEVLIKPQPGNLFCEISIKNTGPAITTEDIPKLFDRFFRTEISRHEIPEGSGLGLAITKSIIQLHGGSIQVKSNDDSTNFLILLPVERSIIKVGTVQPEAN
jgi:two-component system heavy metal sensor histidine kinase CusS